MNPGYGKGVVAPDGWKLLSCYETIKEGDWFMGSHGDEPIPCVDTIGMRVDDTPFVAVFRKIEQPCST